MIEKVKEFKDIRLIEGINFSDERGNLKKTIYGNDLNSLMPTVSELLCVTSKKGVLRGMHFQEPPHDLSKFITCINGKILDVFVDLRKSSKTFKKVGSFELSSNDKYSLFIPNGFAHGYLVLSKSATVAYLQSNDYNPDYDKSINPLSLNFKWPLNELLLSEKDKDAVSIDKYVTTFN